MLKKKFLSCVLACAMVAAMGVSGFADTYPEVNEESQIQPRAYPCSNCNTGFLFSHIEYGTWWYVEGTMFYCEHDYPAGHDETQQRKVYQVWECNSCNFYSETTLEPERREVCYGKDRLSLDEGSNE